MKFKNAKMTKVPQKNPFPNRKVAGTAEHVYSPFVVKNNKGCLLYTSPSPRDGLLSRMPSSA